MMSLEAGELAPPVPAAPSAPSPPAGTDLRLRRSWASAITARHRWWVEITFILGGYWLYELTRGAARGNRAEAVGNGRSIFHAEQFLHLDPEGAMNRALTHLRLLAEISGYYYGLAHFVVIVLVLVWVWWRRPASFGWLRTVLVVLTLVCLVVFTLEPTAPPRLAIPGMTDTLSVLNILDARNPHGPASLANLYAAMPSLHTAWAAWCALAVSVTARRRAVRILAWVYPLLTVLVVLATANHYLFDCFAGAGVLGLAALPSWAARPLRRRRGGAHRLPGRSSVHTGGRSR